MIEHGTTALIAGGLAIIAYWVGILEQRCKMEDRLLECAEKELWMEIDGVQYMLVNRGKYWAMREDAEAWRARK